MGELEGELLGIGPGANDAEERDGIEVDGEHGSSPVVQHFEAPGISSCRDTKRLKELS